MALISVSNLTFAYEGSYDTVFEQVNLQLDTNWKTGMIGRNGRGKTTFLRLLAGELPAGGAIAAPKLNCITFPCVVQDPEDMALTVIQTLCPERETWEIVRELKRLGVEEEAFYRPFSTLSKGEQTKALLAAMFQKDECFPLIDEPTNHLDEAGRRITAEYLRSQQGFLLISHDRAFLDSCVDHVMSIHRKGIQIQKGNFSSWQCNQARQEQFERAEQVRLKKDIHRLESAQRKTAVWSDKVEQSKKGNRNGEGKPDRGYLGHKAAKMMKRSKTIEARREAARVEKEKLLQNVETADTLKLHPLVYHKTRLVEAEHLTLMYGEKTVFHDVSFTVEQGEQVALRGGNGSGKSSLLNLVLGADLQYEGILRVGSGITISYVPQDISHLKGTLADLIREKGVDESLLKTILRKLDFERVQFEKDLSDLSGGQKKKVLIAVSLCQQAHLYLWDEPLNFVDVLSRMQLEELIRQYRPTLLFVEHDQAFTERIATKTVWLARNGREELQ